MSNFPGDQEHLQDFIFQDRGVHRPRPRPANEDGQNGGTNSTTDSSSDEDDDDNPRSGGGRPGIQCSPS